MKYEVLVSGAYGGKERPSMSFSIDVDGLPALNAGIKKEIMREMSRLSVTSFDGKITTTRVVETTVHDSAPLSFSVEPQIVIIVDL